MVAVEVAGWCIPHWLVIQETMPKKDKVKIWSEPRKPRPPKFFLSNREQKDAETLRIQQWLDLADLALGQTGEEENETLPIKRGA
jgi:hypothetical protein